jgi:hypothetical protein
LGPIVPIPESRQCGQPGLAWFQVQNESTWINEAENSMFPHHLAFIMTGKICLCCTKEMMTLTWCALRKMMTCP